MQVEGYKTIRDTFLDANGGNPVFAASAMALALMEDGPNFKRGYPKESAVLTAIEQIGDPLDVDSPSDVETVTLAVDVALKNRKEAVA